MGRRRRQHRDFRNLDGILLLDKPLGLSSNKALQAARTIFKASKAGHTGSLDPLATGMLPICFGEATKYSSHLLDSSKIYRAICQLGATSTTGDGEGDIAVAGPVNIDGKQLETVLDRFRGDINQIPPMHSAVKHDGERLYKLARQGIEVERQSRVVTIHRLDVVALQDDILEIDVHCSKGTYIRTLAEDIGIALGCGAYLKALKRTAVQPFWDDRMYTLDELRTIQDDQADTLDSVLLPMDSALRDWPEISLDDNLSFYLLQGQPVQVPGAPVEGLVRLYDDERGFLGLGQILDDGRVAPRRLLRSD